MHKNEGKMAIAAHFNASYAKLLLGLLLLLLPALLLQLLLHVPITIMVLLRTQTR